MFIESLTPDQLVAFAQLVIFAAFLGALVGAMALPLLLQLFELVFAGLVKVGFTCEGDALQCAIAREQHKRSCELHVNESPESKLYEASKGKTGKVTDDLPGNETIALTDRINTSSALGAGYCPLRDVTVEVAGYSKVLPLSNSCEQLSYVKTFFVGLCLLLALWIVFGRK